MGKYKFLEDVKFGGEKRLRILSLRRNSFLFLQLQLKMFRFQASIRDIIQDTNSDQDNIQQLPK